jgi:hypothetical protein
VDVVVLSWITNMISQDHQEVVQERGHTARHLWLALDNQFRHLWLALDNQFLGNRETRTLHIDAAFHNLVQGDLSVSEYCRKFKGMADALADLGSSVDNWILILNILRALNQRFEHVNAIIQRYSSFPKILKVRDDLLLEEVRDDLLLEENHLDTSGPAAAPMALYSNSLSASNPQPSVPPGNGNGGNNNTEKAFKLMHLDLWTSRIVSVSRSKYYLVILHDLTHYLWTFPLKYDTFTTLSNFFAYVAT